MSVSVRITDSHGNWLGASIDVDEFLAETLDPADDLQTMLAALAESREVGVQDAWEDFLELIGYEEVGADNTYNHPTDLSAELDFLVAMPKGNQKEWYYSDDALLLVKKHAGGDPRGNYYEGRLYRLDGNRETAFLTTTASWAIQSGVDASGRVLADDEMRAVDEHWESGYSSEPDHALSEDVEIVHAWSAESADVTLKNGWRVVVSPWWVG